MLFCVLEPMLNLTVKGDSTAANVNDLKPYSTYMVTIALITKHGDGLHSDPLLKTTMEGGTCTGLNFTHSYPFLPETTKNI